MFPFTLGKLVKVNFSRKLASVNEALMREIIRKELRVIHNFSHVFCFVF